jgi:periplasmic divalent cation tolerance protein
MQKSNFVELVLTCDSWQEAQKIADALLDKQLVACVEFFEIKSKYWWEGSLEEAKEIKLMMHSAEHLFDKVEAEVKKLHSYDTFVLQALPASRVSAEARQWLKSTLTKDN